MAWRTILKKSTLQIAWVDSETVSVIVSVAAVAFYDR